MAGSKMIIGWVVSFLAIGITFAARGSSADLRHGVKGVRNQQIKEDTVALESLTASEVEYVDGPLAPLYDLLIQRKLFKFCKLLRDAELEQTILDIGGTWTLFAPTDASFIFLPGGILEEIQRSPQLLQEFLLYHFVTGDFPSNQIQNEMLVNSVQGPPLRFNIYGQTITVSGAQILEPDLVFDLGRVYIVDRPLYPIPSVDIISYLENNYREFYRLLFNLNLIDYISGGTFTVLVPEDDAFNYLSIDLKDAIATNISLAERIVYNHILPGSLYIGGITDGLQWQTIGDELITFTVKRGLTFANDIPIILPDVPLTNGVIQVLNRMLLPEGIEADCQCKPSSEISAKSGHTSGSSIPSFGQTQRPQHGQRLTTRKPSQSHQRQTPSPIGSQGSQSPVQSGRRTWSPSRTTQTVKPISPVTISPFLPHQAGTQPDDDINSVVGAEEQPSEGQKRPDSSRTTRYPPPQRRTTARPLLATSATTRRPQTTRRYDWNQRRSTQSTFEQPLQGTGSDSTVAEPERTFQTQRPSVQTTSWQQRKQVSRTPNQPTQRTTSRSSRFPTPMPQRRSTTQRTPYIPPTAPEEVPSNEQSFESNRQQPTCRLQGQRITPSNQNLPICIESQPSGCQYSPYNPSDPRPLCPESNQPECRNSNEPFDPLDNRPLCQSPGSNENCREFGQPTNIEDRRPLCSSSTIPQTGCRDPSEPFNPSDRRPICRTTSPPRTVPPVVQEIGSTHGCRRADEIANPQDQRPLCIEEAQQDCRSVLERPKPGDRRPLCPTSTATQTGCRDPSTPFSPSDRRPICHSASPRVPVPSTAPDTSSHQGCRRSDEITSPQDQRPLCPEEPQQDCRSYLERPKPGDRRPLCPTSTTTQTGCRDPSVPFNPSDRRPICRTTSAPHTVPPVVQEIGSTHGCRRVDEIENPQDQRPLCIEEPQQDCRSVLERPNPGDRRPLCPTSTVTQTNCRDPSSPFNPSDRRPTCRSTGSQAPVHPSAQTTSSPQGCKRSDEITSPQDQRPLCPEEPQQDCRSFLERPKPGDRRPVCNRNGQKNQSPNNQKEFDKDQTKLEKPGKQPIYPPRGQTHSQTTRRQSWQSTTRSSQNRQTTRTPQSWQSTSVPQNLQTTRTPQSWQTTRTSQNWKPSSPQTTKALQSWQTTRASQSWQTTKAPQSWQTQHGQVTTRASPSWQTQINNRQPVGKQPQPAHTPSNPHRDSVQMNTPPDSQKLNPESITSPQSDSNQLGPQSELYPSQPESGENPSQPQNGAYPSPQQPGRRPSSPPSQQSGPHFSGPDSGSYPSSPQSGSHLSQPQSGAHTSQPQSGPNAGVHNPSQPQYGSTRPSQPQIGQGQFQPGIPTSGYPQRQPGLPQTQSRFTTPSSQSQTQRIPQHGTGNVRPQQPFVPQGRPGSVQGHQSGSFTTTPRRPTTARVPVSVTGTSTTPGEDSRRTLYEIVEDPALLIRGRPVKLTKIFALFHKAGLEDILSGPGPTTVFLPSDDAFATLPQGVVDQLAENPELLKQVLSYHVTRSEILPSAQSESYIVPSLEGTQLVITMVNGGRLILISGAKAVAVTRANNGIFYVINQLLYPLPHHDIVGAIQSRPDLSTLTLLLPMSGLADLLQNQTPYTFLAPTDNAFAQLPQAVYDELTRNTTALREILLNHVIEGAHYGREFITGGTFPSARGGKLKFQVVSYGYQVNEVNIKTPEIVTGTGVIHLVDQVLLEDSDLKFFNILGNSVAGQGDPNSNSQQPSVGNQQQGGDQLTPVGPISISGNHAISNQRIFANRLQEGGLQSTLGQPTLPEARAPAHGQTSSGQPNVGTNIQSSHGQDIPSRTSTITGRQPFVPGGGQSVHGQIQSVSHGVSGHQIGQLPGQQNYGHQSSGNGQSGHSSVGGQRTTTHNQHSVGTFVSRGQSLVPTTGHTGSGGQQGHGAYQGGGQPNDVAELARSMGLNQFANWVSNTGLLEKIHDGGVYTVFAPTDDAVNSLPEDMVHSIESNPAQVKSILQYHIIPQRVNLNSVTNEETASTLLQGKTIRFNVYQNSQPDCKQLVTASGTPVGESLATMGTIQVIPVAQVLYQPTGTLQKIVEASPILQKLNEAVKAARVTWILSGTGPVTIFAPSDTAFETLSEDQRKTLIEDKQAFSNLLKRHMVRGTFFSSGIQEDIEKKSENNKPIKLSLQEGILTVNSVPVTYADITASNGVLHVVDQFLL